MQPQHIHEDVPGGFPLKMWTQGVPVEEAAKRQLQNAARLPIVFKHIAAMPDVHFGIGATVGSVARAGRLGNGPALGPNASRSLIRAPEFVRAPFFVRNSPGTARKHEATQP